MITVLKVKTEKGWEDRTVWGDLFFTTAIVHLYEKVKKWQTQIISQKDE